MKYVAHIAFLTTLLASASALAEVEEERWPRWYVGISGGVAFFDESDLSGASTGGIDYDAGYSVSGSLGYLPAFSGPYLNNLRFEVELGYRAAEMESYTLNGTSFSGRDDVRMLTYMANAFYDFRNDGKWTPYLGAGAGLADVHVDSSSGLGNTSDSDEVLAYQFLAGVTYAPESIPLTEWGIGYRYFATEDVELTTAGSQLNIDDIASHQVEVSARFRF